MKPISTLLVDDEPLARRGLEALLDDAPSFEVVGEAGDAVEARERILALHPELVFLDISMPGPSGLELARELARELGPRAPLVVFVTAFDQYALDAFDAEAVDYVHKPFDDARFVRALERIARRVRERRIRLHRRQLLALLDAPGDEPAGEEPNENADLDPRVAPDPPPEPAPESTSTRRLVIRSTGRIRILDLDEVDWIEGAGNYVRLHRGTEADLYRSSMNEIERRLDPAHFVRIHRSTLVHRGRVRELRPLDRGDYLVLLEDGTELKLSRTYRHQLPRLLGG